MNATKIMASLAVAGVTLAAAPAYADLIPQDGWGLTALGSVNTNIGHLGLNSGTANVYQQVDGSGNPFNGAQFREFGLVFSTNITPENTPGFGDSGFPVSYASPLNGLRILFSGLAGTVTSYNSTTGAIEYVFTPGVGTTTVQGTTDGGATFTDLMTLALRAPSGGDLQDFFGTAQTSGQSTILAQIMGFLNGAFIDLAGPGLGYTSSDELFFQFQTTNKISSPASGISACSFDATINCRTLVVTSDGSADILKVPEPASMALVGLGLLGLGAVRRRKS